MTRSEIIEALAQRVDVPQIEAGRLMDSFLRKLSLALSFGDSFYLPDLGSFSMVQIASKGAGGEGEHGMLIFRPMDTMSKEDELIFRILLTDAESMNPIDTYFSLSINKPLIPAKGQKVSFDQIPSSTLELKKFADLNADRIIEMGEVVRNDVESARYVNRRNLTIEDVPSDRKEAYSLSPEENLDWEFGGDWKKEYEEQTLLASDSQEDHFSLEVKEHEKEMDWDFGSFDKEEIAKEPPKPEPLPFTRVKSMTSELEIDMSEFDEAPPEDDKPIPTALPKPVDVSEDFDTVFKKSMVQNVLMVKPPEEEVHMPEGWELPKESDTEPINRADQKDISELVIDLSSIGRQEEEPERIKITGITGKIDANKKRSRWRYLSYAAVLLLMTVGGTFLYSKMYGMPEWMQNAMRPEPKIELKEVVPVVYERDYSIPVAYPYIRASAKPIQPANPNADPFDPNSYPEPTGDDKMTDPNSKPVQEPSANPMQNSNETKQPEKRNEINQQNTTPPQQPKQKTVLPEQKPKTVTQSNPVESNVKPAGNVFPSGNGYAVQVLASKDKSKTEQAADRLRKKGFNVSVTEAEVPGKGTFYRVRIQNISTIEEANRLSKQAPR